MGAQKYQFGLEKFELSAKGAGGTMGTDLVQLGDTAKGTALLTTEDNQTTDIEIEESDSPIKTIVTTAGKIKFNLSTYNVSPRTMYKFFGGVLKLFKTILTFSAPTAGTGYTDGTYKNVALSGGTGTGAKADVTVSTGGVTAVTLVDGGEGYTIGDTLTFPTSVIGAGTGADVDVATIDNGTATRSRWDAPDQFPDIELSAKITDKSGTYIEIPRGGVSSKFNFAFTKDKLGQVDIEVSVLQPEDASTPRISIDYAN